MGQHFASMNPSEGDARPRGNTPRQPSRSGRHEAARRESRPQTKPLSGRSIAVGGLREGQPAKADSKKKAGSYDPLAPERVRAIFDGLDRMYPGVAGGLTPKNAWE